jgi:hypothetical protein
MRRAERRGGPGFALEAPLHDPCVRFGVRAKHFRPHQLDRRIARQQLVPRAPHFPHAPVAEELDELVVAQLLRLAQAPPEAIQNVRRQHGHRGARVIRDCAHNRLRQCHHRLPKQIRHPEGERIHGCRDQRGRQHLPRRRGRDHRVDQDADRDPRQMDRRHGRRRHQPGVQDRDADAVQHQEAKAHFGLGLRWMLVAVAHVPVHPRGGGYPAQVQRHVRRADPHVPGDRHQHQVDEQAERPEAADDGGEQREPLQLLCRQLIGQTAGRPTVAARVGWRIESWGENFCCGGR